jgi:hypothetical protein
MMAFWKPQQKLAPVVSVLEGISCTDCDPHSGMHRDLRSNIKGLHACAVELSETSIRSVAQVRSSNSTY